MTSSHAGAMGPVMTPRITPFISGEASVTWNSIQSSYVFGSTPIQSRQQWGGRGAAGVLYPYSNNWSFSSEGGWGYYGQVKMNNSGVSSNGLYSLSVTNVSQLYGFDLLVGALYSYQQFDAFFKVGAMAENRSYNGASSLSHTGFTSIFNQSNIQTTVYPEIKVGGIYNLTDQFGITLAYMHVFGNDSLKATIPDGTNPPTNNNVTASLRNPTLQSVMFGLVYKFV